MYTGVDEVNKVGQIHTWSFQNRTHYQGKCGEIKGSAGGFYPPEQKDTQILELFAHEICRYCEICPKKPYLLY